MIIRRLYRLTAAERSSLKQLIAECGGFEPFYNDRGEDAILQLAAFEKMESKLQQSSQNTIIGFLSCPYADCGNRNRRPAQKETAPAENETEESNPAKNVPAKNTLAEDVSAENAPVKNAPPFADSVEITAVVACAYRHADVFAKLLAKLRQTMPQNEFVLSQTCLRALGETTLPPYDFAYSEYLLRLAAPPPLSGNTGENSAAAAPPHSVNTQKSGAAAPPINRTALRKIRAALHGVDYDFCYSDAQDAFLMYADGCDTPAASCGLAYAQTFVCVFNVFVDEPQRRKGLGTLLMNTLIQTHFQNSALPLILNVRSTNLAAVKLYRKCGFQEAERIDYYVLRL